MDPLQPPPTARTLWLPQEDTSVVVLAPAPAVLTTDTESPSLLATVAAAHVDEQGTHSLFDLGNLQHAQLLRLDFAAGSALTAVVPLDITGFDRVEAILRLLSALHNRAVPPDTRLTRQQRARARRMLQAFDGARDGATQQEIAQIVFQIGRISRDDWQASSVRHTVMALLRDARAMIAGGYRKLLRHRHRR